jgi:hypothetical protein
MANHAQVYLINAAAMTEHHVETSGGVRVPLATWIRQQLAMENTNKVQNYLREHQPGLIDSFDFWHEWAFDEDLRLLLDHQPEVVQRYFGLDEDNQPLEKMSWEQIVQEGEQHDQTQRIEFLAYVDYPLRALNLPGWQFLHRHEVECMAECFNTVLSDEVHLNLEWADFFSAHAHHSYDVVAILYESFGAY